MKEIVKFGLVIGVLLCAAIGTTSAQDYSEDYKTGFYSGAALLIPAIMDARDLSDLYYNLNGQPTDETLVVDNETVTWSDYYNAGATYFNENELPQVNDFIMQVFGPDDDRTGQLSLTELPLIT
jgi:hypothetical protein